MYKPLSDSTLMNMTKSQIIKHLRVAEHNHKVCEETITQQYENFQKLLKAEREKTINEIIENYCIIDNLGCEYVVVDKATLEQLKGE